MSVAVRYALTSASLYALSAVSLSRYLILRWPARVKAIVEGKANSIFLAVPWICAVVTFGLVVGMVRGKINLTN